MRKMGIDYGKRRIGIALTDDAGLMAFPHSVVENTSEAFDEILRIIEEKEVGEIIIGQSLGKDGSPNEIQERIGELVTDLTLHTGLPVHLQPEQYTTQEAIRFQGKTKLTDASAAAVILNSYITKSK
jgi:putative Holliday junction resolvase